MSLCSGREDRARIVVHCEASGRKPRCSAKRNMDGNMDGGRKREMKKRDAAENLNRKGCTLKDDRSSRVGRSTVSPGGRDYELYVGRN